jgi:hypothetical protein
VGEGSVSLPELESVDLVDPLLGISFLRIFLTGLFIQIYSSSVDSESEESSPLSFSDLVGEGGWSLFPARPAPGAGAAAAAVVGPVVVWCSADMVGVLVKSVAKAGS